MVLVPPQTTNIVRRELPFEQELLEKSLKMVVLHATS
jgi:hypothetical protein